MSTSANPRGSRRRRMMSDINVVPYIDVTLVLLIIFMVTAPMIVTGTIDLPRVGQSSQAPTASIEVTIQQDGQISVRERKAGAPERVITRDKLADTVKSLQQSTESPVIISAEKAVRYEHVVAAMDTLQRAGIARVGLHVRVE
jgi:biopolymer transport protein TolR